MLLVEQNATMALSIANHGYVMETGRIVLDKPAAALLKDDDIREFYLGLHPGRTRRASTQVLPRRQALPTQEAVVGMSRTPTRWSGSTDVHLSFRASGRSRGQLRGPPGRAVRDHRAQRRRQDLDLQRALRRLPPAGGQCRAARRGHPRAQALRHRRAGPGPHLPEHRAVRAPDRARQPDARPAPAHPLRHRWRPSSGSGKAREGRSSRTGGSSRRSSTSWRSSSGASCPSACCRTASRSGSSSAGRWRWSPSCCCSTSRWPA